MAIEKAEARKKEREEGIPDFLRIPITELNFSEPLCDVSKVKEKDSIGCGHIPPQLPFGDVKTHTDEGYELTPMSKDVVGLGKDCDIHEAIRQCTTAMMVICSIVPENVDGIDDSTTFTTLNASPYKRGFNGKVTDHHREYVKDLTGRSDDPAICIIVACEIFAWVGMRPSDTLYNRLFTQSYAWGTLYDYFGNDDGWSQELREAYNKITTMGRPSSMVVHSYCGLLIRSELDDTSAWRCHIDDKLVGRALQTATSALVDYLWPELPPEILNYCAITMAMFTDTIDVVHDYHKCRTSNLLVPFVIRGYCIRSVILASYRKTLSVLPEEYKEKFRQSIKQTMYACVTSGRHYVMEQVIGCHCEEGTRNCKQWKPKNSKYCTDEDGEDYMDLFKVTELIEPSITEDRNKLISNLYAYLYGNKEHADLFTDKDLEAKVAWCWSRLHHTCNIHKCPHSDGKEKRR